MAKQFLQYNSDEYEYRGITSDGRAICVDPQEMAESTQDVGVDIGELSGASRWFPSQIENYPESWENLLDPDQWQTCIGANQNVTYCEE